MPTPAARMERSVMLHLEGRLASGVYGQADLKAHWPEGSACWRWELRRLKPAAGYSSESKRFRMHRLVGKQRGAWQAWMHS